MLINIFLLQSSLFGQREHYTEIRGRWETDLVAFTDSKLRLRNERSKLFAQLGVITDSATSSEAEL